MGEVDYRYPLAQDAEIVVRFKSREGAITSYRVILLALDGAGEHTVRLYDNADGINDMHRYKGARKLDAETFSRASAGEAMNEAIQQVLSSYREMIDAWTR